MWYADIENSTNEGESTVNIDIRRLQRRKAAEKRFRLYGAISVTTGMAFLALLFVTIVGKGYTAFVQTYIQLEINFDAEIIDPQGQRDETALSTADYAGLIKQSLRAEFPEVSGRRHKRALYRLVSAGAEFELRELVLDSPNLIGTSVKLWLVADDEVDSVIKGHVDRTLDEENRRVKDNQLGWIDTLDEDGRLELRLNRLFLGSGDSRDPELAGILGAALGSFYTLIVTLVLSFPIGVASAIYLEEFAPTNRWTDLIEVNINNLAAVPSIVFGLLGLAVFINWFGLPRSVPLVGGLVLTLMTLPTVIIASRAALKSVPPSIREAALGMGASQVQVVGHHVLPLAMPGMLTGTIIGMARALGESAPLLMIGMVAFVVDLPGGPMEPSTVLPVQIYLWADSPERAFMERTSGAIMVLLAFLVVMNAAAVILRKRFERRW